MHRESDTHGPRQDDTLKHEMDDVLRGNSPSPVEEWLDPEPPAEDNPDQDEDPGHG